MRLAEFFLLEGSRDKYYTLEPRGSSVELRGWERVDIPFPEEFDDVPSEQETSYERMSSTSFEQALSLLKHELSLVPAEEDEVRRSWEAAQESDEGLRVERSPDGALSVDVTGAITPRPW